MGRLALIALAVLGVAACFDPHSRLGTGDGAAGAGGNAAGAGGAVVGGSGGANTGGAGGTGGASDGGASDGAATNDAATNEAAAGGGGGADGGGVDPCATVSCDDMHVCTGGTCASRLTELALPYDQYPGVDLVTAGPDGNLWLMAASRGAIGRVLPSGDMTLFPLPTGEYSASGLTAGPDGNIWFTETLPNRIGCLTTAGAYIKFFDVPTAMAEPVRITAGADGNLWFTELRGDRIGRLTTAGDLREFPVPSTGSLPYQIVGGPNGDLWYLDHAANLLGHVTPAGDVTETPFDGALDIAAGPDGNVWLAVGTPSYRIVRLTPAGDRMDFVIPDPIIDAVALTFDPQGNIWFTEDQYQRSGVVRMTPQGEFREMSFPNPGIDVYGLESIAAGPGGYVWFTERYKSAIGRVVPW